jgi:hypothetical protein
MATDAEEHLWQQETHRDYCSWVESINASNRANALIHGGPALITDPETGRQKMEGLRPGEMVWFDVTDGPASQRGRCHFYGPGWHGPFPKFGIVEMLTAGGPPTPEECLDAILDFKTEARSIGARAAPRRDDDGILQRLRAALHPKPHR